MTTARGFGTLSPVVAVLLSFGIIGAACGSDDATVSEQGSADGAEMETASAVLPTVSGGQIDVGAIEGTDTILWFWAPW